MPVPDIRSERNNDRSILIALPARDVGSGRAGDRLEESCRSMESVATLPLPAHEIGCNRPSDLQALPAREIESNHGMFRLYWSEILDTSDRDHWLTSPARGSFDLIDPINILNFSFCLNRTEIRVQFQAFWPHNASGVLKTD